MHPLPGWIKLHRCFIEWEWYRCSNTKALFIHLILKANFETKQWQGYQVGRGQVVTGLNALSVETGMSIQTIRTSLTRLEKSGEINRQSNNRFSLITICNYDRFQASEEKDNNLANTPATSEQQTNNNDLRSKRNKRSNTPFDFLKSLIEKGVVEQVAKDWLEVRKRKKASNTQTAFKGLETQIVKSGLNWNEAITTAVTHSWAGFNADWITDKSHSNSATEQNKEVQDRIAKTLQQRGIV